MLLAATLGFFSSCKKDDKTDVQAGFTYTIDATDYKTVHFTSTSVDAKTLSWNFGDGSALATDAAPSHTFAGAGTYTVALTAINGNDQDITSQTITIVDPQAQLTAIAGSDTKGWKLLRVTNANTWPLEVGPIDRSSVWWGLGRENDDIANRPCTMNDEWIFSRDGKMTYDSHGDFFAEGGVFQDAGTCKTSDAANLIGHQGDDYSAFGDGDHTYTMTATALTVEGLGAFIGLQKIGTDAEVFEPQSSVTYDILKLDDSGPTDTLILESKYKQTGQTADNAYWKIVLVHYDDPSQEPGIPEPKPVVSFSTTVDMLMVTFTNTTVGATSYSWDFGDGGTSTASDPTHTYSTSGQYTVTLTATNAAGSSVGSLQVIVSDGAPMTADQLVGGAWKILYDSTAITVGPGLGDGSWWQVKLPMLDGTVTNPEDNWSCILDDEFIFTAGGSGNTSGAMQYKTNGTARNDGYFGTPNGCWSDAEIAASPGAPFGSNTHAYEFIPANLSPSNRPVIKLTNGAGGAAFIGFYKGYYGGENGTNTNPPNGGLSTTQYEVMSYEIINGKEVMTVSVDLNGDAAGGNAWNMKMTR